MNYITEYKIEPGCIQTDKGILRYNKVTPVFAEGEAPIDLVPEGNCFLYEDYSSLLKPGDTFYEITLIKVEESSRRKGVGTRLVKDFINKCSPASIVLQAGITDKDLYEQLCDEDRLIPYIRENLVPFYEKLGFTDVNNTMFCFEEMIPMLWPKSKADEAIRVSKEFRERREVPTYSLVNLIHDPSTLIAVMEKHSDYAEWFNQTFPNGASSKEEVLSKL